MGVSVFVDEFELDLDGVAAWFTCLDGSNEVFQVPEEVVGSWTPALAQALQRCYVSDAELHQRCEAMGLSPQELLATKLPDWATTMSGDFGEVLTFLFQGTASGSRGAFGPKKWRFKQDRNAPAPKSDVVQFVMPGGPEAPSEADMVLCAEVKSRATPGTTSRAVEAIEGALKDQTSRLAATLAWFRELAHWRDDLGTVTVELLDRFGLRLLEHPPFEREFNAVVVVSSDLLKGELENVPDVVPPGVRLVFIAVPELRKVYQHAYAEILARDHALEVPP